ncbi:hypothetical protein PROFUN_00758 [Planoprotostelium fungivorum]|uniref:Uncharacterized protein n=1 Tax=Planoprotostelium fungivorum TaxID=1890364 RepID=A0A2P6NU95_9EUKA|nr:hypothetical protein PROFUN_00758 [Planoprotostelium fungivorum]
MGSLIDTPCDMSRHLKPPTGLILRWNHFSTSGVCAAFGRYGITTTSNILKFKLDLATNNIIFDTVVGAQRADYIDLLYVPSHSPTLAKVTRRNQIITAWAKIDAAQTAPADESQLFSFYSLYSRRSVPRASMGL